MNILAAPQTLVGQQMADFNGNFQTYKGSGLTTVSNTRRVKIRNLKKSFLEFENSCNNVHNKFMSSHLLVRTPRAVRN